MNNYPLTVIERLVHDELPKQPRTYKEFYASIIKELENETDRIMQDLPRVLSTIGNYEALEIYLQSIQQQLLLLMEKVIIYIPAKELQRLQESGNISNSKNGNMIIYSCLDDLLLFMHRHFERYMDMTYKIPMSYFAWQQKMIMINLKLIEEHLDAAAIDRKLSVIVLLPLYGLRSKSIIDNNTTYERMKYLRHLSEGLMSLVLDNEPEDVLSVLHDLLLHLNFNNEDYIQYIARLITEELAKIPTTREKLAHLYFWEKKVSQRSVKEGISYLPNESSLKQQLENWITGEIKFIKQHEESSEMPSLPKELARFLNFKIRVKLSINEVSYLLDIAYEAGVFDGMKKAEILEFIAYFISSKKKDNIALRSLRNKMYKPAGSIIKSIKKLLLYLLDITEKDSLD